MLFQDKEERLFLEFAKTNKCYSKYYDGFFILFKTGLRVSEFCGLTKSDIDFKENKIKIDHQLQRTRDMQYIIEPTKTPSIRPIINWTVRVATYQFQFLR